jgi:uncharacterized membrane protein
MATLFALVYPDVATAEDAATTARGLVEAGFLDILDSSLVTKDADGKVEHQGERPIVRKGVVIGGVVGGLTGLIFAIPVVGIAAGVAVGTYVGKSLKPGVGDDFETFRKQVGEDLKPGGAALLLLGESTARERLIQDLGRHGGTLRSTDLSDQQIEQIQYEIDKATAT